MRTEVAVSQNEAALGDLRNAKPERFPGLIYAFVLNMPLSWPHICYPTWSYRTQDVSEFLNRWTFRGGPSKGV